RQPPQLAYEHLGIPLAVDPPREEQRTQINQRVSTHIAEIPIHVDVTVQTTGLQPAGVRLVHVLPDQHRTEDQSHHQPDDHRLPGVRTESHRWNEPYQ